MATRRGTEPAVHGFLNLYKPVGIASMEAVRQVKRITGQRKKVGHAGTLDPLAEGVLPICFGQATRLMELVVSGRKRYRMTVRLGATSATYDAEGEIEEIASPVDLTRGEIADALARFVGSIEQVPPMYSAIKVDGRRLYEMAREGREIKREPRRVRVYAVHIDGIDLPFLRLTVECGRGTYLRSIAHDLGQALGVGGYVTELSRLTCGGFTAENGVTLETLERTAADGDWRTVLHPVDWALRDLAAVRVSQGEETALKNGQAIRGEDVGPLGEDVMRRAYNADGVFLAVVEYQGDSAQWQPRKVFQDSGVSPYAPPQRPARDTGHLEAVG